MDGLEKIRRQQTEVILSLEEKTKDALKSLLPSDKLWYPSQFLPDSSQEDYIDKVKDFREQAKNVRPAILCVLVGNTLTEENLPAYMSWLNRLDKIKDETGDEISTWAKWIRGWTAEEQRHGSLLSKYLMHHPKLNRLAFDKSVHSMISLGANLRTGPYPYHMLVYTSFQERATMISHKNTGMLAGKDGDENLELICQRIAGDEGRHEVFYSTMMKHVFSADPTLGILAYKDMMDRKITMPGELMQNEKGEKVFPLFSAIAQAEGIYTAKHYAEMMDYFNTKWEIDKITGLSPEAQKAQEELMALPARYSKLAERAGRATQKIITEYPWVNSN